MNEIENKEQETNTTVEPTGSTGSGKLRAILIAVSIGLFAAIVFGLLWLFFLAPTLPSGTFGWFLFSFAAGITMIVLPCTLPLAFVIVPLSMGRGLVKGLGMALSFGLGVAITLSLYGVAAAAIGGVAIDALGAPLETIKNWVYFIAGIFALFFALSEIKLLRFRMPTYSGAAPAFIQHRQDYLKALFLGLFLGNIGVGCPHPATPLILIEIASSGDILYGWLMFLVHAIGRILPLLLLAFLGILGVNGLKWLVARKDKVERATGWAMVFVAGFILTLGLFTHNWWINSGIHTQFEKVTQEARFTGILKENLGSDVIHAHGISEGEGLFGLPLSLGNYVLVLLWVFPLWWWWFKRRKRVAQIAEDAQTPTRQQAEKLLRSRMWFITALTLLLGLIFIYLLPHSFLEHQSPEHEEAGSNNESVEHVEASEISQVLNQEASKILIREVLLFEVSDMSERTKILIQEALTGEVLTQGVLREEVKGAHLEEDEGFVGDGHTDHEHATPVSTSPPQEDEGFVGDGHTDHGHAAPLSTIPWWQSQLWWILFISSLVLMGLLSFGVSRYLRK